MAPSTDHSDAIAAAAKEQDFAGRAVIGTDADGNIVYWNEPAASLYGWAAGEAIGKNVLDLDPSQLAFDEATHIMTHMRAAREWAGDFMVKRRDGTPMVMHVATTPVLSSGAPVGVVGVSYLDSRRTPGSMRAIKDES